MSKTVTADRIVNTEPLPRIRDARLLIFFRAVWLLFAAVALIVAVVSIPAYIQSCNCSPQVVAEWERLGIAQGVRILAPDLPRYVAHAVMKALEKNPDERFAAAGDLASAFMEEVAQAA